MPVGIARFNKVRDDVASGLKPLVDGGLDWLQANHYRTVLHVRQPGQDDSVDRQQVEKFGMKFLSIEVSPQTLTRSVADQFNKTVSDPANYPLFVYDQNGKLAGALWYLSFRLADRNPDATARSRAAQIGLKDEDSDLWLAIQKVLAQ
jgi:protein tyrosine phosphatase (PTP) superfamily phosphohydrolase (DUF442 family)